MRFEVTAPLKMSIEFDNDIRKPLFLLINPVESSAIPDRNDPAVRYYAAGQVYHEGKIELRSNETIYIEEGAIVYGVIESENSDNITIRGRGILNGSTWSREGEMREQRFIRLTNCWNVRIEGITLVDGPCWHLVPVGCANVRIDNLNIITFVGGGDGIDIVGCQDVVVRNCFIRSKDDCVAIKTYNGSEASSRNVRNILITGCVFWNAEWGNAFEIGYETTCEEITNIWLEDTDIIRCEFEGYQSGGTFTIHNGDRALIHDVCYENIRVEDSREKLIDIKVLHAQYSHDEHRGQVRDIYFKDIHVVDGPFPVSIIRGFDGEHMIDNVTVENLTVYGKKISNANEAKMVVELSRNIVFI
ncbi:MAG: hypothetical protein H7X86_01670 [Gorillibacterium sp.]|nr:hypothetical protein [Gorillibacterium sp.]